MVASKILITFLKDTLLSYFPFITLVFFNVMKPKRDIIDLKRDLYETLSSSTRSNEKLFHLLNGTYGKYEKFKTKIEEY